RKLERIGLGRGHRLDQPDLGPRVGLAVLDQLVNEFADRTIRVVRHRLRLVRRLQHASLRLVRAQASSSSLSRSLERPVFSSRASAKPTIAAPATAMPGLLRTKLRVSSISSSGFFEAMLFAVFSIAEAARRA